MKPDEVVEATRRMAADARRYQFVKARTHVGTCQETTWDGVVSFPRWWTSNILCDERGDLDASIDAAMRDEFKGGVEK